MEKVISIDIAKWPQAHSYADISGNMKPGWKPVGKELVPFGEEKLRQPMPTRWQRVIERKLPTLLDQVYEDFLHEADHLEGIESDLLVEWMEENLAQYMNELMLETAVLLNKSIQKG